MPVKVTGIEALSKELNALPSKLHQKVLRSSINKVTEDIAQKIKNKAPTAIGGEGHRSMASMKFGRLRDKIRAGAARRKGNVIGNVILAPFYWLFLEKGTQERWTKKRFRAFRGRVTNEARFVNPVLDDEAPEVLQKMLDEIAKQISSGKL